MEEGKCSADLKSEFTLCVWEKAIYEKNSELVEHGEYRTLPTILQELHNLDSYIGFCLKLICVQQARWDLIHHPDGYWLAFLLALGKTPVLGGHLIGNWKFWNFPGQVVYLREPLVIMFH